MTEKIICPECGAENPEDAVICGVCHTSLEKDESALNIEPQKASQDNFDLLNTPEDDLPGLLHALKQEDNGLSKDDQAPEEDSSPALESEDIFETDDDQESEDIPDWLHRIRQRASEEEDSAGEVTQKISAAKESLAGEKRSSQHENFESWIQNLRGPIGGASKEDLEEDASREEIEEEPEDAAPKEPDWLQKIRKAAGKTTNADITEGVKEGEDGLLNWLDSLEGEEEEKPSDEIGAEETDKEEHPDDLQQIDTDHTGVTQEIIIDDVSSFEVIPPKLNVTSEEKNQAEKLASMIMDEKLPRPVRKTQRRSALGSARFFLAIILIAAISISAFLGQRGNFQTPSKQPHTEGFLTWVEGLSQGSSLLLVFDYHPAFSSEINLAATPVLDRLVEDEIEFSVVTSSISGPILYRQLFRNIGGLDIDSVLDLGYIPIGSYAAFDLGMGFSANWELVGLPDRSKDLPSDGFEGILIFADTYEGARAWIEQLTTLMPQTPVNLLVTEQALPMLMPYFDSEQVTGIVSGLNDAAILEAEFSGGNQTAARWWAYQAGVILLIMVMVIGAIYAGNQHEEEGEE